MILDDLPDRLLAVRLAGRRPDELVATIAEARVLAQDALGRVDRGGPPATRRPVDIESIS